MGKNKIKRYALQEPNPICSNPTFNQLRPLQCPWYLNLAYLSFSLILASSDAGSDPATLQEVSRRLVRPAAPRHSSCSGGCCFHHPGKSSDGFRGRPVLLLPRRPRPSSLSGHETLFAGLGKVGQSSGPIFSMPLRHVGQAQVSLRHQLWCSAAVRLLELESS